ncbi:MAG: hypothetical protein ACTSO2_19755 [Promethearchaeota archaeon]
MLKQEIQNLCYNNYLQGFSRPISRPETADPMDSRPNPAAEDSSNFLGFQEYPLICYCKFNLLSISFCL